MQFLLLLFKKFRVRREALYEKYVYLPAQLLFTWLIYKVLAVVKLGFLFSLTGALMFFVLLLFPIERVLPRFINNFFFQLYLLVFYSLLNFCGESKLKLRFLGFILGAVSYSANPGLFSLKIFDLNFIVPDLNFFFLFLLLFSFFKGFNQNIVFKAIHCLL